MAAAGYPNYASTAFRETTFLLYAVFITRTH